jgi:hypothetical protein
MAEREPNLNLPDVAGGAQRGPEHSSDVHPPLALRLLADIKLLFELRARRWANADKYPSRTLCDDLAALPDRPWRALPVSEGQEVRPITPKRLSALLRDFAIRPRPIRLGTLTPYGFKRQDFTDAWQRYLPGVPRDGTRPAHSISNNGATPEEPSNPQAPRPARPDTTPLEDDAAGKDSLRQTMETLWAELRARCVDRCKQATPECRTRIEQLIQQYERFVAERLQQRDYDALHRSLLNLQRQIDGSH